jgi:hypothetical protein
VLDPWTRLLSRPLIWNDGTRVGDVELAPDDPRARALDGAIRGSGPLTAALRAAGVRFVLDDADGPGRQVSARLPGSVVIIDQPGLTVYQLPGALFRNRLASTGRLSPCERSVHIGRRGPRRKSE